VEVKVLTIRPPWSDLIALGFKKVEFRTWKADYRGPLVIHAGLTVDKPAISFIAKMLSKPWSSNRYVGDEQRETMKRYLVHPRRGMALAIATLASIDKSEYHDKELGFAPEMWGWVLEGLKPLKREVPMTGQQGLFTVKGSILDQIQRAAFGESKDIKLNLTIQELNKGPLKAMGPSTTLAGASRKGTLEEAREQHTVDGEGRRYVQKGLFKVPE
jgi:hypothetical protein